MLYLTEDSRISKFKRESNLFMKGNSIGKKVLTGLFIPAYVNIMLYTLLLPDIISKKVNGGHYLF